MTEYRKADLAFLIALIVILLAALADWCRGAVMELTVEGMPGYDHGENLALYGGAPLPFVLRVRYDDSWSDLDPADDHGLYEGAALVTLDFTGWHFAHDETQVQVWAGSGGLWGVTFGSDGDFEQNGLFVPDYKIYASFIQPFAPFPMTDRLEEIPLLSGALQNEPDSYSYIRALRLSDALEMEAQQTGGLNFSVREVPELNPGLLLGLGLFFALVRRRQSDYRCRP